MNPAIITKTINSVLPLSGFAGVEVRPDQVEIIVQDGLITYSILSALEAFWENRDAK